MSCWRLGSRLCLIGTALTLLAGCQDLTHLESYMEWAPDGQHAYVRTDGGDAWMLVDHTGNIVRPMTEHAGERILGWMPNSRDIIIVHQVSARSWHEYASLLSPDRINAITGMAKMLSVFARDYRGDWSDFGSSPGGKALGYVAYVGSVDGPQLVFYLRQTNPKLVSALAAAAKRPVQKKKPKSGKGAKSEPLFTRDDLKSPPIFELRTRDAFASGDAPGRLVSRSADAISWARSSPSGSAIAFNRQEPEGPHLYVSALHAGATPLQVDNSIGNAVSAAWSTDGRSLAFLTSEDQPQLFDDRMFDAVYQREVCDAAGHVIAKPDAASLLAFLTPTTSSDIAWLPDGELLFVSEPRPAVQGTRYAALFSLRPESEGVPDVLETQVQSFSEDSGAFVVSPDGDKVAVTDTYRGRILVYSVREDALVDEQTITFSPGKAPYMRPSWRNANELSYTAAAWDFPGGPLRSDRVVLTSLDGGEKVLSDSWPDTTGFLEKRYVIDIEDDEVSPSSLTVPVDTTVTWKNDDAHAHALSGADGQLGFDSKIPAGATFSTEFHKVGTYAYQCSLHACTPGMIVVTASHTPPSPSR